MSDIKYMIKNNSTILQALVALNEIGHAAQTLFVVNAENKMVGTLTDGDIRRNLISGCSLETKVNTVMHRQFHSLRENEFDVEKLRKLREMNIFFIPVLDECGHIIKV